MIVETKYFGKAQYTELAVISFPAGLPGFDHLREFLCIEQPGLRPLVYLQSLTEPQICFLSLPVRAIEPGYELEITDDDAAVLKLGSEPAAIGQNVACLAILCTGPDRNATANLLAPVVINISRRIGAQIIQVHSQYDCAHPLHGSAPMEAAC
jgi:flagellar assembly factor FliW